jgi:hypothetical protein
MLSYPGLYLITSPIGKQYIGIATKSFRNRFICHRAHARFGKRTLIADAFREFGDQMRCEPLVVSDNVRYLQELEIRAIKAFNTLEPNGYNKSPGGGVTSERSAKKISDALRGREFTVEWRAKLGQNRRGLFVDDIFYPSRKAAGDVHFLNRGAVGRRLRSVNFPSWIDSNVSKVFTFKRGRPKGSKDKRPRKLRTEF